MAPSVSVIMILSFFSSCTAKARISASLKGFPGSARLAWFATIVTSCISTVSRGGTVVDARVSELLLNYSMINSPPSTVHGSTCLCCCLPLRRGSNQSDTASLSTSASLGKPVHIW